MRLCNTSVHSGHGVRGHRSSPSVAFAGSFNSVSVTLIRFFHTETSGPLCSQQENGGHFKEVLSVNSMCFYCIIYASGTSLSQMPNCGAVGVDV